MSGRRARGTGFLVGMILMVAGVAALGPSLVVGLRYRAAPAVLLDAFAEPLDDGRVRLAVVYEYEIRGGDVAGFDGPVRALGYARCDRFGQPQDDLVLSDADAVRFITEIRRGELIKTRVWYDPDDPLRSGQARYAAAGDQWPSLPHLGFLLLLASLAWSGLMYLRSRGRTPRPD